MECCIGILAVYASAGGLVLLWCFQCTVTGYKFQRCTPIGIDLKRDETPPPTPPRFCIFEIPIRKP